MKRKIYVLILLFSFFVLSGFTAVSPGGRAVVDLVYNGKNFRYTDDLITATDHLVAEEIYNKKINAPLNEKLCEVDKCLTAGGDYKAAMLRQFPLLYKTVDKIIAAVNCDPKNSQIRFNPDRKPMFTITKEQPGFEIGEEALYREIYQGMRRGTKAPIPVRPRVINPQITAFDNAKLTSLRARFSTEYSHSCPERKNNIRRAIGKINGSVINGGGEFSFNRTVGPRNTANGFLTAKIIIAGEYVDGVGGGVCQASTTLYNAALLSDLEILQARPHSLPPSYVPPSFDAMVNSGSADLKIKNSGDTPVFIRAVANDSEATVEIYGSPLPYHIAAESVTLSQNPPPPDKEETDTEYKYFPASAVPGEKMRIANGHGALKSEGYLIYRNASGAVLSRKFIRRDTYSGVAGTVMIAP